MQSTSYSRNQCWILKGMERKTYCGLEMRGKERSHDKRRTSIRKTAMMKGKNRPKSSYFPACFEKYIRYFSGSATKSASVY